MLDNMTFSVSTTFSMVIKRYATKSSYSIPRKKIATSYNFSILWKEKNNNNKKTLHFNCILSKRKNDLNKSISIFFFDYFAHSQTVELAICITQMTNFFDPYYYIFFCCSGFLIWDSFVKTVPWSNSSQFCF